MVSNQATQQTSRVAPHVPTEPIPTPMPPPARSAKPAIPTLVAQSIAQPIAQTVVQVVVQEVAQPVARPDSKHSVSQPAAHPLAHPEAPRVGKAHSVPPKPHFGTRFPTIDPAEFETLDMDEEIPERSLASPRVIGALLVSTLLLCAVGWFGTQGSTGVGWNSLKQTVQKLNDSSAVAEEDLPYITANPLVPMLGCPTPIDDEISDQSQGPEQVVRSELAGSEQRGEDEVGHVQRR